MYATFKTRIADLERELAAVQTEVESLKLKLALKTASAGLAESDVERLQRDCAFQRQKLTALENAGVDNWEGYELAMESLEE